MENQLITDVIAVWKGFGHPNQRNGLFESKCRLRIWRCLRQAKPTQDKHIVLFSDLDEQDTGTSITNCSENIATLVYRDFKVPLEQTDWFQYYPRHNTPQQLQDEEGMGEEVDKVNYSWDGTKFESPVWQPSSREHLEGVLQASISMDGYKNLPKYIFKVP